MQPVLNDLADLVTALRRVLGIAQLGEQMATAREQIDALNNRLADLISDVRANNEILQAKAGQLDEEGQAALDRLSANVAAFDVEIGDADGSETATSTADDEAAVQESTEQ